MRPALVLWLTQHGLPGFLAPDYMMLVGLSSLVAAFIALRHAEREGASVALHARAFALAYVVAIPGGDLFEAIRVAPAAIAARDVSIVLHAGRAAYGGLIASIGVAVLYLRRHREPIAPFLERIAIPAGIIFASVRTGCFLAGCDYGAVTASRLGVRFPAGSLAAMDHAERGLIPYGAPSLPVHATELYEAGIALVAAIVASRVRARAFPTWLAIYATGRFFIEFLRGDVERGAYGGLSTAQWVSLAMITGLVLVHARATHRLALVAALAVFALPSGASAQQRMDAPPTWVPPAPTLPPPRPPRPDYVIDTRIVASTAITIARSDVPSGGALEVQGLYRFQTGANAHIGLGLEYRYYGNVVASHHGVGVPVQFALELGRVFEMNFTFALLHTWINFRSPFFAGTNAWASRLEYGLQFRLGNHAFLGLSPLSFHVVSAESIGVINSWEPRMWFGMSF